MIGTIPATKKRKLELFRDTLSKHINSRQYGSELRAMFWGSNITKNNRLRQMYNTYNQFKSKIGTIQDHDHLLSAAINFALAMYGGFNNNPDRSLKLLHSFFEYVLAEIKRIFYAMPNDFTRVNNNLVNCSGQIVNNHQGFDVKCSEFQSISNNYKTYSVNVTDAGLVNPDPIINDQGPSPFKLIKDLAHNSRLRFNEISTAVYHWLKHSVEDCYENGYLDHSRGNVEMLTPIEYKQELTAIPIQTNGIQENDHQGDSEPFIKFVVNLDDNYIDNIHGKPYNKHQRYLNVRVDGQVQVVTYFKRERPID